MRRKRTEITIETSEVYVFKRAARPTLAWCARCAAEVFAVTAEMAAALAAAESRDSLRLDGRGEAVHFNEPRAGELPLVCFNSLRVSPREHEVGRVREWLLHLGAAGSITDVDI